MHVVATAGHVDHGKSTLVRALTGMEPDRWAEERRRGMTIDLGYAWAALPGGEVLAFVDVPGHQRFIGNMLAGLGPAPAVLVVVAADEGWRRQSGEHLAAVDALGLTAGVLAVTRSDLADPGPATAEALEHLRGSSLRDVEAVAVSGATGAGLDDLRAALGRLVARLPAPRLDAPVRLWVDRAFTVRGSGTVVTGTLGAGVLRTGDELQLGERTVRVRGLQSLGRPADEVAAVARVAVNLRGVERSEVARGDALLTPGAWVATSGVDVRLSADPRALPTVARPARRLDGGRGPRPAARRRHGPAAAAHARCRCGRATARCCATPARSRSRPACSCSTSTRRRCGGAGLRPAAPPTSPAPARCPTSPPRSRGAGRCAGPTWPRSASRSTTCRTSSCWGSGSSTPPRWQAWAAALGAAVDAHAAAAPLEGGLPAEAARRAVDLPDLRLLAPLVQAAGLVATAGRVRRPGTTVDLGPAERSVAQLEERLRADPFAAPEGPDLDALRLGARELAAAERAGRLLRLRDDVVLLPDAPARAMRVLAGLEQPFTLSLARQALGTTRRVAVPLLEHLDGRGWTRRLDGSLREVRR